MPRRMARVLSATVGDLALVVLRFQILKSNVGEHYRPPAPPKTRKTAAKCRHPEIGVLELDFHEYFQELDAGKVSSGLTFLDGQPLGLASRVATKPAIARNVNWRPTIVNDRWDPEHVLFQ